MRQSRGAGGKVNKSGSSSSELRGSCLCWSSSIGERALSAFGACLVILSTLRASSRAAHMIGNGGRLGRMDGPTIEGPKELMMRGRKDKDPSLDDLDENLVEEESISPLWERTELMKEALQTALLNPFPLPDNAADSSSGSRSSGSSGSGLEIVPFTTSTLHMTSNHLAWKKSKATRTLKTQHQHSTQIHSRQKQPWIFRKQNQQKEQHLNKHQIDFTSVKSFQFYTPMTQNHPPQRRHATVAAYAPGAFSSLRLSFGINEQGYLRSMLHSGPFVSFQSNSKGAARVGGFFFFTNDGAYMVKTVKKEEAKQLFHMLPKYYSFMKQHPNKSLLTRICGVYSVSVKHTLPPPSPSSQKSHTHIIDDENQKKSSSQGKNYHNKSDQTDEYEHVFVVMNSVFPAEGSKFISQRFDLKGSTVGRECSQKEKLTKGSNAVLKDLDLKREVDAAKQNSSSSNNNYGIQLGSRTKKALLSQLKKDVELLIDCGVMDYSLLVGVVNLDSKKPFHPIASTSSKRDSSGSKFTFRDIATTLTKSIYNYLQETSLALSSPLPYYGAELCGVDGGSFAILRGRRLGHRAIYYLGLIDFLQPWTLRKVLERDLKGMIGYNTKAISCVAPEQYGKRFLEFLDAHIT